MIWYLHNSYLEDGKGPNKSVTIISKAAAINHSIQYRGYLAFFVVWTMVLLLSVLIFDYRLVIMVTEWLYLMLVICEMACVQQENTMA